MLIAIPTYVCIYVKIYKLTHVNLLYWYVGIYIYNDLKFKLDIYKIFCETNNTLLVLLISILF